MEIRISSQKTHEHNSYSDISIIEMFGESYIYVLIRPFTIFSKLDLLPDEPYSQEKS